MKQLLRHQQMIRSVHTWAQICMGQVIWTIAFTHTAPLGGIQTV